MAERVAVTGGRHWRDRGHVWRVLDGYHQARGIAVLIHGKCRTGVDAFADAWARSRGVPILAEPAEWKRYGRAAGPIRNQMMVDRHEPDVLLAFPGGEGTKNMIGCARRAGVPVVSTG